MKEPYGKGLAIHTNPKSCASRGNTAGEAPAGARAGRVSSCGRKEVWRGNACPWNGARGRLWLCAVALDIQCFPLQEGVSPNARRQCAIIG